ncbi:MAG: SDR family oxidoreductase [Nitrososphaeraceae archaeon]|nr:SDR family oxidoreductase [Nitrososphaeraceae archaeon]
MTKVAVVTGSSSGIGFETSLLLAKNQFKTYATMRNLNKSHVFDTALKEGIPLRVAQLDVNDDASVNSAINSILKENGQIDVLVNNAGYSIFGSLEELSLEEIKQEFETNFFGAVRVTKAVIPTMRKNSSGTIVNVSSIGGKVGLLPFFTAYHASKFALEGYTESLRQELNEFGINVILIEPGAVGTNFMDNMKNAENYNPTTSPYAGTIQKFFEGAQAIMANSIHPREVAEVILNAVNSSSPNIRYFVGKDGESILKNRAKLSDKEMEKWARESYVDKKGFIRK